MDNDKREFLDTVCKQISYKPIQKELRREIKDHIEDSSMDGVDQGMNIKDAERHALSRMGNPIDIGKNLNKLHHRRISKEIVLMLIGILFISYFYYFMQFANESDISTPIYQIVQNLVSRVDLWIYIVIFLIVGLIGFKFINTYMTTSCILLYGVPALFFLINLSVFSVEKVMNLYLFVSIPVLCIILYKNRHQNYTALFKAGIFISIVIGVYLRFTKYQYHLLVIFLLSCFTILLLCVLQNWFVVNKKNVCIILSSILAIIFIAGYFLLPYMKAETKMFFSLKDNNRTVYSTTYDGVVIRDLIGRASFKDGVKMDTDEILLYKPAMWMRYGFQNVSELLQNENFNNISIEQEKQMRNIRALPEINNTNASVDKLLPSFAGTYYQIARMIIRHGWWIGLLVLILISFISLYLIKVSLQMKNKLAFILAIGSSSMFILQMISNVLLNFGFMFSEPIAFPIAGYSLTIAFGNVLLLGIIFSAYRYDTVIRDRYRY